MQLSCYLLVWCLCRVFLTEERSWCITWYRELASWGSFSVPRFVSTSQYFYHHLKVVHRFCKCKMLKYSSFILSLQPVTFKHRVGLCIIHLIVIQCEPKLFGTSWHHWKRFITGEEEVVCIDAVRLCIGAFLYFSVCNSLLQFAIMILTGSSVSQIFSSHGRWGFCLIDCYVEPHECPCQMALHSTQRLHHGAQQVWRGQTTLCYHLSQ